MNITTFIQELANTLDCQYSLGELLNLQNHNRYFIPDGIIYREQNPYIIIEAKNQENSELCERYSRELARIQDYMGILWSILLVKETILLRPIYGDFENYGDVLETAQIIKTDNADTVPPFPRDVYLEEIKQKLSEKLNFISRKDSISHFIDELNVNDIEITKEGVFLTSTKETEFFMSLLTPVEKKEIWRYTTKDSLFLMLRDHNQNMLSLNCMNDSSEIDYADKYIDVETCILRKSVDEANSVFILSCCDVTKCDDLMMWRLYAQDAEGVSLCYHLFPHKIDNDYFYLAYVCYSQKCSHPELDLIKNIMDWSLRGRHFRFRKWIVWKHFFKPYDFNYENEIRLIYLEHDNSMAKNTVWIEDHKSGIASPMKLFCLEEKYEPRYPLALIKVIVGPKSKEPQINLVQFRKMYNEAKLFCPKIPPEFEQSKIDIYR